MKIKHIVITLFTFLIILTTSHIGAQIEGNWSEKDNFIGDPRFSPVSFTIGDRAYIGLGTTQNQEFLKDIWEYNPSDDTWKRMADYPGPDRQLGIGFSIGDKGYVGLGRNADSLLNDVWEYDSLNDSWLELDTFPGIGKVSATAFTIGNLAYVGTGNQTNVVGNETNTFWEFDPNGGTWTQKADFPGPRRDRAISFTIGNFAYLGLGFHTEDPSTTSLGDFWQYNPADDSWIQKADYGGQARSGPVGFVIKDHGYVGLGFPVLRDVWKYSPDNDSWEEVSRFPSAGRFNPAAFSIGDNAYIVSGFSNQGGNFIYFEDCWEFDSQTLNTQDVLKQVEITILPNPSSEKIVIDLEGAEFVSASILDLTGNSVLKTNQAEFVISHLTQGTYLVLIETSKGTKTSLFAKI